MLSIDKIFPYIVSSSWVDSVGLPSLVAESLARDVYVVLVSDEGNVVKNIHPNELSALGLSVDDAFHHATMNHHEAWNDQRFQVGFGESPEGFSFGAADGSWLAPGVLLNSAFYEQMSESLQSKELVVVVPNQELLIVFPNLPHCLNSSRIRQLLAEARHHPKQVSETFLLLNGEWPSELVLRQ